MRRIIINADDFGLTRGINRAVAELHDAGALSSATLMATGDAFDDAVAIAKARPGLGVGCHIVLVDGVPVSPPSAVTSLLGADGVHFRRSLIHFLRDLYLRRDLGRIDVGEIETEAVAQIEKLQRAGIDVTHIDTHKHTHMFPRVTTALLSAAARCGVKAVRNPFEENWSRKLSDTRLLRGFEVAALYSLHKEFLQQKQIRDGAVMTTNGTIGIAVTGTLKTSTLQRMIETMPTGTWELVCHPGYNDADLDLIDTRLRASRDVERNALMQEIPQLLKNRAELLKNLSGVELINYGKINNGYGKISNEQ
jgi:hopanoid biosynthesis associated protein HpnK